MAERGLSKPRMGSSKNEKRSKLKEVSNKPAFRIFRDLLQKVKILELQIPTWKWCQGQNWVFLTSNGHELNVKMIGYDET